MKESWGSYFRSDKVLLVALFLLLIGMTAFIASHANDPQNMSWAREQCGVILGALIMLITGASKGHNEPPPGTVKQVTTQTTVQEAEEVKNVDVSPIKRDA